MSYLTQAVREFLSGALDAVGYYGHWVDVGEKLGYGMRESWEKAKLPRGLVGRSVFRVSGAGWEELGEILHVQPDDQTFGWALFVRPDGTLGRVSLAAADIRVDNNGPRDIRAMRADS